MVSKSQHTVWCIARTREAKEAVDALRALLPAGLVGGGAGVEVGVEDDSDRTCLFVRSSFPAVPEVLAGDVCWPGEETIGSGAVH